MLTQTLVVTLEVDTNCNETKLKDSIEELESVESASLAECNSEKYKDCLSYIAKSLKRLEDRTALVCPLRELRQEIEDCLEQDITSNMVVDTLSNAVI